jgi:hypothetical protein
VLGLDLGEVENQRGTCVPRPIHGRAVEGYPFNDSVSA